MATPATERNDNLPTVALLGRVNVGKSSLFNRLIEDQKAITSEVPGTTRTNNVGEVLWRGKRVRIIDTGGVTFDEHVQFETEIRRQTEIAIKEADVVVLVVDGEVGVIPEDVTFAKLLRKMGANLILVANKIDSTRAQTHLDNTPEWKRLGLGTPIPISAINGRNTGDFLDAVYDKLKKGKRKPKITKDKEKELGIHISLIGKPNVGKSSLFNKLIGEDRVIVSPIPHTTREPYDTELAYTYTKDGKDSKAYLTLVDTAGIRRKSNVSGRLEQQGIGKSILSIERSDIVLFVLDMDEPISSQDMQLGGLLERHSKSVIIVLNKWDKAEDVTDAKRNEVKTKILRYFPHLSYAPLVFTSGLTGYRVHQIFPLILEVWQGRNTEISQSQLELFLKKILKLHHPARGKGTRHPEILGIRQLRTNPPMFELSIKQKTSLHMSYVHFIEGKLREDFNFFGTPIVIKLTKMKK